MTIHKRDLRKNILPADFSQDDLDDLIAKGLLRKTLSGPYAEANKKIIDVLLAQRPKRKPMSAYRSSGKI